MSLVFFSSFSFIFFCRRAFCSSLTRTHKIISYIKLHGTIILCFMVLLYFTRKLCCPISLRLLYVYFSQFSQFHFRLILELLEYFTHNKINVLYLGELRSIEIRTCNLFRDSHKKTIIRKDYDQFHSINCSLFTHETRNVRIHYFFPKIFNFHSKFLLQFINGHDLGFLNALSRSL